MTEDKKPTFEEALKNLEEIVQKMESGALPLDESIKLYEQGIQLKKLCEKQLEEAKLKVEKVDFKSVETPQA